MLLENLRFNPGEKGNDPVFAQQLASLGEVFVNDAFGTAHRAHASTDAMPRLMPQRAAGYLMRKEIECLGNALNQPKRPFVALVGGAKLKSKISTLKALAKKVDTLIIGGGMAWTFLKAKGYEIGTSLVDDEQLEVAGEILAASERGEGAKILLPVDALAAERPAQEALPEDAVGEEVSTEHIPPQYDCLDIGPDSIKLFGEAIKDAKTVTWNGPMGLFERSAFAQGTLAMAQAMAECGDRGRDHRGGGRRLIGRGGAVWLGRSFFPHQYRGRCIAHLCGRQALARGGSLV